MRPLAEHGKPQNFECQCKSEATTIKKQRERWKIASLNTCYPLSRSANKTHNYGNLYRMRICVCGACLLGHSVYWFFTYFAGARVLFLSISRWQPRKVNIKTQVEQKKNRRKMEHVCWTHRVERKSHKMEISTHTQLERIYLSKHNRRQAKAKCQYAFRFRKSDRQQTFLLRSSLHFAQKEINFFSCCRFLCICFYFVFVVYFSLSTHITTDRTLTANSIDGVSAASSISFLCRKVPLFVRVTADTSQHQSFDRVTEHITIFVRNQCAI